MKLSEIVVFGRIKINNYGETYVYIAVVGTFTTGLLKSDTVKEKIKRNVR